jgi:hypothetical protein
MLNYYVFNSLTAESNIFAFEQIKELEQMLEDNFIIPWKIDDTKTEYYRNNSLITE